MMLPTALTCPPVLRFPPLIFPVTDMLPAWILPTPLTINELPMRMLALIFPAAATDTTLTALVQLLTPLVPKVNRSLALVLLPRLGSA